MMTTIANIEYAVKNSLHGMLLFSIFTSIVSVILISLMHKIVGKYFLRLMKHLRGRYLRNTGARAGYLDATLEFINMPVMYSRFIIFEISKIIFLSVLQIGSLIALIVIFYLYDIFILRMIILVINITILFFWLKKLLDNYSDFVHGRNSYIQMIQENKELHKEHSLRLDDLFPQGKDFE